MLPSYIGQCLKKIEWMKSEEDVLQFHPDDLVLITYGTRGSTPFSGPESLRYGGNTTCYQIYSPKLPDNYLYLGDGGSGILEIDKSIIKKCFSQHINPFSDSHEKVSQVISCIINTYTHYHYDHLHTGAPLAGLFHSNSVHKTIIGAGGPHRMFQSVFQRPIFPRDFSEMEASFDFHEIRDVRSSVIALFPSGDFKEIGISEFKNLLHHTMPQIKHKKVSYHLSDCLIVKCFPTDHPDPCISYRYENYSETNKSMTSLAFMTDHEISETDYRENYFKEQVCGTDVLYIDGQYQEQNYIPGFGHGRVELIGVMGRELKLPNITIGHHDPAREDRQIDAMIEIAKQTNQGKSRIFAASDRMMVFIPAKTRGRTGIVIGRMDLDIGERIETDADSSSEVKGRYCYLDLTTTYQLEDFTKEADAQTNNGQ